MLFFWSFIANHSPWIEEGEWWPHTCLFLPRQAWTCITLCHSNKLNLLFVTSNLTYLLLNILPATNKPLLEGEAFVFETFLIFSLISTSLSHEIAIENSVDIKEMPPNKILQARCVTPGASFHRRKKFF